MGPEGHFLGVALGLLAYGAIVASGVRPAVWRSPRDGGDGGDGD